MGIFTNALPFSLLTWGQQYVASSFAGLTMALVPMTILPLSFIIVGETITLLKIFGFFLGFLGIIFLIGFDGVLEASNTSSLFLLAKFACISSTFCYALGTIITRLCPSVHPLTYAAIGLTFASFLILPFSIFVEGFPKFYFNVSLIAIIYLAIFPTAIATLLLTIIIRNVGVQFLSLVNYQVPIWSCILGVIVLNENLPKNFVIAFGLIMCGLYFAQNRN